MSKILQANMSETMEKSYMDYAKDVIVSRTLADVRDGLKPVHRRIIYAMNDLKIYPNTPFKKSARIVGEVLGKYHPHGDSSVYEAMVRMAQDFSLRYPLVSGHGNFGSIDGDSAAAMRYTEAKMDKISLELIKGIEKDTVDFIPNFDGEEKEPSVLPARFPNLLANGSSGIAVGFASNMPPHNLTEVIDGIIYKLNNKNANIDDIMQFIKAPDFPGGGTIINPRDIKKIYELGKGKVIVRAKHQIEYLKDKNKEIEAIVITEIPYQVNKAKLVESISDLSKEIESVEKGKKIKIKAKIQEISDIRDESDRNGMRIVVELKKKGDSQRVLQLLYKYSQLQNNFNVNNVALVNGIPKENISLIRLIDYYIEHQKEVIRKQTIFDKKKTEKQLHIYNGLILALDNMDNTINVIRKSKNRTEAKELLINTLKIDEMQSEAILQMKLQRLTNLEKDNIFSQVNELNNENKLYDLILNDESILNEELVKGLTVIKDKYGDNRRTLLVEGETINKEMLIEDYNTTIIITNEGYIKKMRSSSIKSTNKNRLKEGDYIIKEIKGKNRDTIILFSNEGNAYQVKANDLKELKQGELGELVNNYYDIGKKERITAVVSTGFDKDEYMISIFEDGKIAKIGINSFKLSTRTFKYNNKILLDIMNIKGDKDILLVSSAGKGVVFNTGRLKAKIRRATIGVAGIKLDDNEKCIGGIIDVYKDNNINLYTDKDKAIYIMLDDVSTNENKNWFNYLYSRPGNRGNFIYNTRALNTKVVNMNTVN
ncbi:MAG: DNA topoisomerase (ATP-hydrolyzing) [Romboutsia sp.]